jgi:hypothetical protein
MRQFIIIGGPTRSGTNTVSTFVHLHEDTVCFGSAGGLHPMNDEVNFIGGLCFQPKSLQTTGVLRLDQHKEFIDYLDEKNERIRENMQGIKQADTVCIRWDYGESIFPIMLNNKLRMITVLRPIDLVFRSQVVHMYTPLYDDENQARKIFNIRMTNSFLQLKHLSKKLPDRVLYVDITTNDASEEYTRILSFLDLQPNDYQLKWIDTLPITNRTDWESQGNPQYGGDFKELEEMRQELLTIGRPK